MYQILINTVDFNNKLLAANVPANEVGFIKDELRYEGGFTRFDVDVYDEKISASSYEDYGRFLSKEAMQAWLYENVFKNDYKDLETFKEYYRESLDEYREDERIKNLCLDILYNDYTAVWENEKVFNRLYPHITSCMSDDNERHPNKAYLRRAIRRAFVEYTLYSHED